MVYYTTIVICHFEICYNLITLSMRKRFIVMFLGFFTFLSIIKIEYRFNARASGYSNGLNSVAMQTRNGFNGLQ